MHIYIFGSLCRGEIDNKSDIDILILSDKIIELDYNKYSIYSYEKIRKLWNEGNPFAWHLHLESKLIFSSKENDFIKSLGEPSQYLNIKEDFYKFKEIYYNSIKHLEFNQVFNLSCVFLSIRNIATCYSLYLNKPVFSRLSMTKISPSIDIPIEVIKILEKCRILSTRGTGESLTTLELDKFISYIDQINNWIDKIEKKIHEKREF